MSDIVIIGASASGISAAKEIRKIDPNIAITLITDDSNYPYYRPFLTEYIGNSDVESKSNFFLNNENWYAENNINLIRNEIIKQVLTEKKTVISQSGHTYKYDKLILATGSNPFVPIKGALGLKNIFTVRSLADARKVYHYSNTIKKSVIIGGGPLGLEAAYSLHTKGIDVTIIELGKRLLAAQLDQEGSEFLYDIIHKNGVNVQLGESAEEIIGDDIATAVKLSSGRIIETEMIIFSIGVRSNLDLPVASGIAVDKAIVVNEKMETSVSDIYACGDVSQYNGKCIALWMPAIKKGKVAGSNAAGKELLYDEEIYPSVLNSFNTRLFSFGEIIVDEKSEENKIFRHIDSDKNIYKKVFFRKDIIAGFILINDISQAQKLSLAVKEGKTYTDVIGSIIK
ncbi:MAG TPA: FAD-dependent oxidoreductase [Spirochaetota bacterium]|nr:FAD-dependent oxidoreductase [Spirochaetota bacterium]HPR46446.1 FAD-dependent oxidoreductase [Spirochaetota bacterium]